MDAESFGFCRNHQNEYSVWYCRITKEFICDICMGNSLSEDHLIRVDSIEFKNLFYQLAELFLNEYKNQLRASFQRLPMQTQIEIFFELLDFDKIIPNDKNNQPVTFVYIKNGIGYGDSFQGTFEGPIAKTQNRIELNRTLILRIKKYIKKCSDNDLFVKRLRDDKNSIYDLSSKKLMQYINDLWSIKSNQERIFSQKLCEKCQLEKDRIRIPCSKKHLICQKCLEKSVIQSRYYCPIDFDTFPDTSIRYFWEEIPKCKKCETQYNLTLNSPKILPCSNIVCLKCLPEEIPPFSNCIYCGQLHSDDYYKQSKLITDFILLNQIRCHKHPKITNVDIRADSMKPMCADCKNKPENIEAEFFRDNITEKLRNFILERREIDYNSIFNDVKHWKYSNQQMIDLINWLLNGRNGSFNPNMRGTPIFFNDSIENGRAVLTRFHSLMPPLLDHDQNPIYSPWIINSKLHQVEVLTFKTSTPGISITGLGISAPLIDSENDSIEYIAIEVGEIAHMIPNNILINHTNFRGEKEVQDFYFEQFPINIDTWYTIQVKINAREVFRGSPLGKPFLDIEHNNKSFFDIGSEGTIFEFSSKVSADSYLMNISLQNYLHGPIIKIYYSR